jgi:hypothetical protein
MLILKQLPSYQTSYNLPPRGNCPLFPPVKRGYGHRTRGAMDKRDDCNEKCSQRDCFPDIRPITTGHLLLMERIPSMEPPGITIICRHRPSRRSRHRSRKNVRSSHSHLPFPSGFYSHIRIALLTGSQTRWLRRNAMLRTYTM